jgi:hypothetical protein
MAVPFSTLYYGVKGLYRDGFTYFTDCNGVKHILTIQYGLCPTTGFVELQDLYEEA